MTLPSATTACANSSILAFQKLNHIQIAGMTALSLRFKPARAYLVSAHHKIAISGFQSPLVDKKRQCWQARTEPLWWSALCRKDIENKRVVRSWVARKIRVAFQTSLKKQGYAADGTPICEGETPMASLFGTAQLTPEKPSIKMSLEDLVKQTDLAVLEMMKRQGKRSSNNGQHFSSKRPILGHGETMRHNREQAKISDPRHGIVSKGE